jgi:DNA-binding CsgD family transcriptional regulator
MQKQAAVLAHIIGAIGEPDFAAVAARAILEWVNFELTAVVVHRRDDEASLLFDNFDSAGGGEGITNYVSITHRLNPVLQSLCGPGAFRARDFVIRANRIEQGLQPYLIQSTDEELGYRTIGWPEKLEEIALYFEACGGTVELGLYRERGSQAVPAGRLRDLGALGMPIAAAFERHGRFAPPQRRATASPARSLSRREAEITEMLLIGCNSEAIALRLGISRHTVKDYRKQIFRKLGIASLAELFALHRQSDRASRTPGPPLWRDGDARAPLLR